MLLVDDEEGFTRLLKLNLERGGKYHVRVVNQAGQALAAAREFAPNVMLLDVIMPEISGIELAGQMQADGELKAIPIVFLTATARRDKVQAHHEVLSGYPVISKPAPIEAVVAAIEASAR